jgi:hypothetical protein
MIFHDDGFAVTGSHTILHQKLLVPSRKSSVTLPQGTAKNEPPESSRFNLGISPPFRSFRSGKLI